MLGLSYFASTDSIQKIKSILDNSNYEIKLFPTTIDESSDKLKQFDAVLAEEPDYIIALYSKEGSHGEVSFSLGYIASKFPHICLEEKLFVLVEKGRNPFIATKYLRNDFNFRVHFYEFESPEQIAERILIFLNTRN